jgi:hypothetical protein
MNVNSLQVLQSIAEASKNAPIRQSRDSPAMSYWIVDMDKRDVAPNATHLVPGVMCSL